MAVEAETSFTIQWHITERCNCRCLHCYQEDCRTEADTEDLDRIRTLIDEFYRDRKGIVTVTGGEPLLHPDFFCLLDDLRHPFGVLTNGTLIDNSTAVRLAEARPSFVQVSIEGGERTHDSIRGKGSYSSAVEGIKNLVRARQRVLISFTAHRRNYRELPAVARLGRRLGVDKVWVDRLIPAGSGSDMEGLDPQQSRELFAIMRKSRVAMDRALQFLAGGRPYQCQAGRHLMAILPGGDVLPCRRMPILAGNLHQETLEEIYQGSILQNLRETETEGCQGCLYQKVCRGGLRCLAYAMTGSPFEPDPACWIARSLREPKRGKASPAVDAIVSSRLGKWIP